MNLNTAVVLQTQPNTGQGGHISHGLILHQWIFLPVMGIFGWLLQLKYTSGNASPFVTDYVTMLMFVVAFFVYFAFFTVKLLVHALNSDTREFLNNMTLLFGTLASILLLLILVQAFGLFALLVWTIYFVRDVATKKSYVVAVRDVFHIVKEMINGNLVETNAVQPQPPPQPPPPHIVLQIQDAGEPNNL